MGQSQIWGPKTEGKDPNLLINLTVWPNRRGERPELQNLYSVPDNLHLTDFLKHSSPIFDSLAQGLSLY